MKTLIFGKHSHEIEEIVKNAGFEIVKNNPELVISYGGDGTLMLSESQYPGIPKLLLKSSKICKLCEPFSNEEILKKIKKAEYSIKKITKIEVEANNITLHALNDIIVHNSDPRHAIRYHVSINNEKIHHEIIGDGVVVATPFGSTGYYKSITGSIFSTGLGIAYNNSTEQSDHMVLEESDEIKISIVRGPATIYADNQPEFIELKEGDEIKIRKSKKSSSILRLK